MIIENPEALKTWLTTVLAPLCDADPAALAKYVLALAKKDRPESELRGAMVDQLDVFLQQETKGFVDLLFVTLESKSYLQSNPEAPVTKVETGVAAAVNGAIAPSTVPPLIATVTTNEAEKVIETAAAAAKKEEEKKVESRDTRKKPPADKDDRRIKRRSWSSRSRSRSRSRERLRRSRSRDRTRERGRAWDDRRRRSPVGRRPERRRSRSPVASRRSRSPRSTRRVYRTRSRSRSPKALSPRPQVPKTSEAASATAPPAAVLPPVPPPTGGPTLDVAVTSIIDTVPVAVPPLVMQSVVVAPVDNRPKFRCLDYDEKGYCMRGDLCPYDHGTDPVVLEDVELSSMLNYSRPPPGGPPPVGPPPHLRGPPPSLPPPGEPYNPDAPGISWPPPPFGTAAAGGPPHGMVMRPMGHRGGVGNFGAPPMFGPPPRLPPLPPPHMRASTPMIAPSGPPPPSAMRGPSVGLLGPVPPQRELISVPTSLQDEADTLKRTGKDAGLDADGGAVKKGHFDYSRLGGAPPRRFDPTNCCLEVKKIPRGLNNISVLNNHFSKFGKIVNLQVGFSGDVEGALVTFSSHAEAQAAYRSTEAVLNNRFIKVFWHNKESPEKGKQENVPPSSKVPVKERLGGANPQRVLTQSQTSVVVDEAAAKQATEAKEKEREKVVNAIKKSQEMLAAQEALKKKQEEQKREATKLQVDLQRRKQELLEKQLQQQRVLIERLEKNKSSMKVDERESVMKTVRILQESIEKLRQGLQQASVKETAGATGVAAASKPNANLLAQQTLAKKSLEEAQKDILDAEIELYQKQQEGVDTTDLQRRVKELHAEAKHLTFQSSMRGVVAGRRGAGRIATRATLRGRGRGLLVPRGGARGRGRSGYYMPPHVSVDRRPTQLKVTGFENSQQGDILAHFASFGEVVDYEVDDSLPMLTIRYKARKDAEMALVKGRTFQETSLLVTWNSVGGVTGVVRKREIKEEGQEAMGLDVGSCSADEDDEDNEDNEGLMDDLLNYEEDDEDEVERPWRR